MHASPTWGGGRRVRVCVCMVGGPRGVWGFCVASVQSRFSVGRITVHVPASIGAHRWVALQIQRNLWPWRPVDATKARQRGFTCRNAPQTTLLIPHQKRVDGKKKQKKQRACTHHWSRIVSTPIAVFWSAERELLWWTSLLRNVLWGIRSQAAAGSAGFRCRKAAAGTRRVSVREADDRKQCFHPGCRNTNEPEVQIKNMFKIKMKQTYFVAL